MSDPKLALFVASGDAGTTHYANSPEFTDFVGGQPLWLSFKWKATRKVANSNIAKIRASILWYDSTGSNFQTTFIEDIVVDATQGLTFKELRHVAPIGAVKGVCRPQITPTTDPISHDVWVQDIRLGKTQLFATAGATWGGDILNVPANLGALVGDEAIKNKDITDRIFADDKLDVSEKMSNFARLYADLESRYTDLRARAVALSVSTTALDAARTKWQNMVSSLSPAWNDTTQDTILSVSVFGDANFPANWAGGATSAANGIYTTITDSSTGAQASFARTAILATSASPQYSMCLNVKKDAIAQTTRSVGISIRNANGTFNVGRLALDTKTGQFSNGFAGSDEVGCVDMGDEWFVWLTKTFGPDNTGGAQALIYPAYGTDLNGGSSATTGSVDVRAAKLVLGDYKKLGREMLRALQVSYSLELTRLAKAISEKDATLSTWAGTGNRPANLQALTGLEAILNSGISIAANGALIGAGSGQVTFAGIGGHIYASTGPNAISDPTFDPNTVWSLGTGVRTARDNTNGFVVGLADYCVEIALSNTTGGYVQNSGQKMPVTPGQTYVIHCDLQRNASANGNANFGAWYYQIDNTFISSDGGTGAIQPSDVPAGAAPKRITRTTVAPANAAYVIFRAFTYGTTSPAGAWRFESPGFNPLTLDHVQDGGTFSRILGSELTNGAHKLGIPGSGKRVGDQRNLPAIASANLRYKFTGTISYSATSTSATISVTAGSILLGSSSLSLNAMSTTVTGTAGATTKYDLYITNGSFAGGSFALTATTNGNDIFSSDDRMWIGTVSVAFPTSGSGSGGGSGGGGFGDTCVQVNSWVLTKQGYKRARDVAAGDWILALTEDLAGLRWVLVTKSITANEHCYRLTSESGIELVCSGSTPLTLRNGEYVFPPDVTMVELPVHASEAWTWEDCRVAYEGIDDVQRIYCGGAVYAAGAEQGAMIFTHNPIK